MGLDKELEKWINELEEEEKAEEEASLEHSHDKSSSEEEEEEKWENYYTPTSASEEEEVYEKEPETWSDLDDKEETSEDQDPNEDWIDLPPSKKKPRMDKRKHKGKVEVVTEQKHIGTSNKKASKTSYLEVLQKMMPHNEQLEEVVQLPSGKRLARSLIPVKQEDPGSFPIPILLNGCIHAKGLADSGACVSTLPYSMYKNAGLKEMEPYHASIEFVDSSSMKPKGIVKNVLVEVDEFVVPADFVVLDIPEKKDFPVILGRPFLATAKAHMEMASGKITLHFGNEQATYRSRYLDPDSLLSPMPDYVKKFLKERKHELTMKRETERKATHEGDSFSQKQSLGHEGSTKESRDNTIKEGSKVLYYKPKIRWEKLVQRWTGPYTVTKLLPGNMARVEHPTKKEQEVCLHLLKIHHGGTYDEQRKEQWLTTPDHHI